MKRSLSLTILFGVLFINIVLCQDSILIKTTYKGKHTGKIFEEYYINPNDSLKNNIYKRYSVHGKVIQLGNFKDGNPIGIWNFYESNIWNRKYLSFDFDTQSEIFYKDFNQKKVYCLIKVNNGFELKSIDSIARFPGGKMALHYYVFQNLRVDISKFKGSFKVNIEIKEDGKIRVLKIRGRPDDIKIRGELIKLIQNMPNWIPAIENENPVSSKYVLPIRF